MRFGLALACLSLSLLLAAPSAIGGQEPPASASAKAKAKKKCKKNRVKVKVGSRTKCLPVKAALPKPRAVDQRLAVVVEGLTPPIGSTPDPKGKLPTSMEEVYRQFGPKALPAMEKVVGTALPKLDNLAAAKAARPGLASASAGEANTFSQTIGGVKIDARLSLALEASGEFAGRIEFSTTTDKGGGQTLKVTTEVPIRLQHFGFESDVCPGADGKVNATDGIGITVRSELRSNGGKSIDEYYVYEVADDTELQGIVADDAKLDTLEIRSIEDVSEKAWQPILGGVLAHGTVVRNTVVDMRANPPAYKPSVTLINVGVVLSGLRSFFTAANRQSIAERMKKAADKGFAATVDFEVKQFRQLEGGWLKANRCAKLKFSRANRSLTLHRGEKGSEAVQVDAVRGGSPEKAKWSLETGENGIYGFASDSINPTSFRYEVGAAGFGFEVKATLRAVSKAGIAEDTWIQKTEQKSIERISGIFDLTTNQGGSVLKWAGNAELNRTTPPILGGPNGSFKLSSGLVTVTASGNGSFLSAPLCSQKGSKQLLLSPGSEFTVFGTPPEFGPPYDYSFTLFTPEPLPMLTITLFNCGAGSEELEGDTFDYPVPLTFSPSNPGKSADGFDYTGSESTGAPGFSVEHTWSFHGSE